MKCLSPIVLSNPKYSDATPYVPQTINVPCGHCVNCLINRQQEWIGRLCMESFVSKSVFFITLTYDDDHLPAFSLTSKRDVVLFLKRLRKRFKSKVVRYFICSEYGPTTQRPHYHGLLFFKENVSNEKIIKILEEVWHSYFTISPFTANRARYSTKYLFKDLSRIHSRKDFGDILRNIEDGSEQGGTHEASTVLKADSGRVRYDYGSGQNYLESTGEVVKLGGFSLKSNSLGKEYIEKYIIPYERFLQNRYIGNPYELQRLCVIPRHVYDKCFSSETRERISDIFDCNKDSLSKVGSENLSFYELEKVRDRYLYRLYGSSLL